MKMISFTIFPFNCIIRISVNVKLALAKTSRTVMKGRDPQEEGEGEGEGERYEGGRMRYASSDSGEVGGARLS